MCNLNILIKKDYFNQENLLNLYSFINSVTYNSFENNKDGDGIYLDSTLLKSTKKLNLTPLISKIKKSNFILTHQRIATSGFNKKYLQPFKKQDFVFMHNGVISEYSKNRHSDTFNLFNKFLQEFNNLKDTREENIKKSIKNIFDKSSGSWSISIFDEIDKCLYYFKNNCTSINFYQNEKKDLLYITTLKENQRFLNILFKDFEELDIKYYTIYKIFIKDKIIIEKIGEIDKNTYSSLNYYGFSYKDYDCFNYSDFGLKKNDVILKNISYCHYDEMKYLKQRYIRKNKNKGYCYFCNNKTKNVLIETNSYICDSCLKENLFDLIENDLNIDEKEVL